MIQTGCSMTGNDPLFWNKVTGAILCAVILAWVTNAAVDFIYQPTFPDKPAYVIGAETPAADATAKAGDAEKAVEESAVAMLGAADAEKGKKVARKCVACHSFDKGGPNKIGPNLWDVVGNKQAFAEGYSYSGAFKGMSGTWDYAALDAFLRNPKAYAKGTKMTFAGIPKAGDRADLIAYLRSLSDSPKPLP